MALSKTFASGAILTAADVNNHLVNHVPAAGQPFAPAAVSLANPGGWSNHSVIVRRVGLIVVMTVNTQIGSASSGSTLGVIPEGLRPFTSWEESLIANTGGGTPVQCRIADGTGAIVVYWPSGPGTSSFIRGSSVWIAG